MATNHLRSGRHESTVHALDQASGGEVVNYSQAKQATDANGKPIHVGDRVRKKIFGSVLEIGGIEPDTSGPEVIVVGIHKQGYDGTILTTEPAPDPSYPHHFSGRAKHFVRQS